MAAVPSAWGLALDAALVPPVLKAERRWVCWVAVPKADGKVSKVPRQPGRPDKGASINTPAHWGTFDDAAAAYRRHGLSGVGYVLTRMDGAPASDVFAVDLDHCVDDLTGEINPRAREILDQLGTYYELSPSGLGIRAFGLGTLPGPSVVNHQAHVEVYDGADPRYVTVTGHGHGAVTHTPPATLAKLYAQYKTKDQADAPRTPIPELPNLPDCVDLEADATLALSGECREFWHSGVLGGRYPSRSELLPASFVALLAQDWTPEHIYAAAASNEYAFRRYLEARAGNHQRAREALWKDIQRAANYAAANIKVASADAFDDITKGEAPRGAALLSNVRGIAQFGDESPPIRDWIVEGYIPRREVTALSADGGTGKTLAAMQLQVAMDLSTRWFNVLPTKQGRSLGLYLEDDIDEIHRRFHAIAQRNVAVPSELVHSHVLDREFEPDNLLMTFKDGVGRATAFFRELRGLILAERYDLVVLDPAANLFGGNENDRREVTQFVTALRVLAHEANCAVLLLVHPSRTGIAAGTGDGGSTAWNNAVRSRMFLNRVRSEGFEADPNARTLTRVKANYAMTGEVIKLVWDGGVFDALPSAVQLSGDAADDALFLDLLVEFDKADRQVSTSKHGNYAPRLFTEYCIETRRLERTTQAAMAAAMSRLLKDGRVEQVPNRTGYSMCLRKAQGEWP